MPATLIEASAPGRIDLAGGTLDLWPLHVLHPGSITVNIAIDRFARCRVGPASSGFRLASRDPRFEQRVQKPSQLLSEPRTALVGSLLEALEVREPLEIEFWTEIPFGSGLGGSSALAVALLGALEPWSGRDVDRRDRVAFIRDVETRVLGKPAGVQDYYPPLEGGAHIIGFPVGGILPERVDVDPSRWGAHVTLYDSGASHSSGMNNWEIFRARLEGDGAVAQRLEEIRAAAAAMAQALRDEDFPAMGAALSREWEARRRLAPVVATPAIDRAISVAMAAGAWGGKACGAGGGGCVVLLSPADRAEHLRRALERLGEGSVMPVRLVNEGLRTSEGAPPAGG